MRLDHPRGRIIRERIVDVLGAGRADPTSRGQPLGVIVVVLADAAREEHVRELTRRIVLEAHAHAADVGRAREAIQQRVVRVELCRAGDPARGEIRRVPEATSSARFVVVVANAVDVRCEVLRHGGVAVRGVAQHTGAQRVGEHKARWRVAAPNAGAHVIGADYVAARVVDERRGVARNGEHAGRRERKAEVAWRSGAPGLEGAARGPGVQLRSFRVNSSLVPLPNVRPRSRNPHGS